MLAFWYQEAYDIGAQSNLAVRRRGGRATSALFRLRSDANRILRLFVGVDLLIYKLRPRRCLRFRKCPVDRKKRKGDVYSQSQGQTDAMKFTRTKKNKVTF